MGFQRLQLFGTTPLSVQLETFSKGALESLFFGPRLFPVEGSPAQMADELRAYAREGIGHVQLVLDPITRGSIAAFAPVLAELDRA